ncbi:hypothetical protein DM56_4282 [Burkholderia mallei]|nr:hypothetical protein DM75_2767 [Burkholderia mallei]KOS77113.1 hypothetical protein DM46_2575 [Burkholderia mallei]KOT01919.1 hypothetical protein DM50_2899 [Burkholderia mallei]KOT08445.1 hypothetical protein DM77_2264 [Burkholderia mallei]KOT11446.1 hypothetical protein DM56_4282 [Burkholderia mallei]
MRIDGLDRLGAAAVPCVDERGALVVRLTCLTCLMCLSCLMRARGEGAACRFDCRIVRCLIHEKPTK